MALGWKLLDHILLILSFQPHLLCNHYCDHYYLIIHYKSSQLCFITVFLISWKNLCDTI